MSCKIYSSLYNWFIYVLVKCYWISDDRRLYISPSLFDYRISHWRTTELNRHFEITCIILLFRCLLVVIFIWILKNSSAYINIYKIVGGQWLTFILYNLLTTFSELFLFPLCTYLKLMGFFYLSLHWKILFFWISDSYGIIWS